MPVAAEVIVLVALSGGTWSCAEPQEVRESTPPCLIGGTWTAQGETTSFVGLSSNGRYLYSRGDQWGRGDWLLEGDTLVLQDSTTPSSGEPCTSTGQYRVTMEAACGLARLQPLSDDCTPRRAVLAAPGLQRVAECVDDRARAVLDYGATEADRRTAVGSPSFDASTASSSAIASGGGEACAPGVVLPVPAVPLRVPQTDVDLFCDAVVTVRCAAEKRCSVSWSERRSNATYCTERTRALCLSYVGASARAGRLLLAPSALPDLEARLAETPCNALNTTQSNHALFDLTRAAVIGTIPLGAACYHSIECVGLDSYCESTAGCPGTCKPRTPKGSQCSVFGSGAAGCVPMLGSGPCTCSRGLSCISGHCMPISTVGGACGFDANCTPGLVCRYGSCVMTASAGQPCHDTKLPCATGAGICFGGVCVVGGPTGAPCDHDRDCAEGPCDAKSKVCTTEVTADQKCHQSGWNAVCAQGYYCSCGAGDACSSGVCRAVESIGTPCKDSSACETQACVSGKCSDQLTGGQHCTASCDSGVRCQGMYVSTCGPDGYATLTSCAPGQGCIDGQCQVCAAHAKKSCYGNSVHWYSACGVREELVETCPEGNECSDSACVASCKLACHGSGESFTYTCATPTSSTDVSHCSNGKPRTSTTKYANGHKVTCTFSCSGAGGFCADDTGRSCPLL